MKQLKEFQKKGVQFMTSRRAALLADDMGLGKTVQAAAVIKRVNAKKSLVLTLASLKINWVRELKEWVGEDLKYQIIFKIEDKIDVNADIIVCNYDLIIHKEIRKQLAQLQYDVLILDEAHCLTNRDTQRTKAVYGKTGLVLNSKRVYALTGTPIKNRPREFYTTLRVLAPECIAPYTGYENYAIHYCNGYYDSYGVLNDKGASNVEELAERIKPFMLRRTKQEVLPELPPLIEKVIDLEVTPEIQAVMDEEQGLYEDANEYNPNSELGIQARVRRLLGLAKVPQVVEYARKILETEQKIVIFAFHRDVINEIRTQLKGYGVRVIMGGIGAKLRQMEIDLFVKDPNSRIFIGQYTAAGFGVDGLQKVASNVIHAEIDWVPGNMDQARDRLYRIGQENPVIAHYLILRDTLENDMYNSVLSKKQVINKIMSSSGGNVEHKKEKEKKDMTIEQSLERIADALEKMVGIASTAELACNSCECPNAEDAPKAEEPKKKATKKAAKKAEPVAAEPVEETPAAETVDDFMADLGAVQEPERVYTADDVRTAFSHFLAKFSNDNRDAGVAKAKEILAKYGCSRVTEIPEEKYAAVINELNGGK